MRCEAREAVTIELAHWKVLETTVDCSGYEL